MIQISTTREADVPELSDIYISYINKVKNH
jgi:hypothetical protein